MSKRDIVFLAEFENKDMLKYQMKDIREVFSNESFNVHLLVWYKGKKLPDTLSNTLDKQFVTNKAFNLIGKFNKFALPGEWPSKPFALVSLQIKANKKIDKIIAAYNCHYKLVRSGIESNSCNVVITDNEQDISQYLVKSNKYINKFK